MRVTISSFRLTSCNNITNLGRYISTSLYTYFGLMNMICLKSKLNSVLIENLQSLRVYQLIYWGNIYIHWHPIQLIPQSQLACDEFANSLRRISRHFPLGPPCGCRVIFGNREDIELLLTRVFNRNLIANKSVDSWPMSCRASHTSDGVLGQILDNLDNAYIGPTPPRRRPTPSQTSLTIRQAHYKCPPGHRTACKN